MARDIIDDRLLGALHVRALTRAGLAHDHDTEHAVFQAGTLDALMDGRFDGDVTIGEILEHGDLGIGTIQRLGGELVILDGEAWVVDGDGRVRAVPPDTRTPFVVVVRFRPIATAALAGPLALPAIHAALDALAPPDEPVLAVRVAGRFTDLRLRSVHEQAPPYPPLTEVTEHQTEWAVAAAAGTLLGFRFPAAAAGVEVPGYHLHFLSDDRARGGHVLAATLGAGTAAVADAGELHVELPAGVRLGEVGAGADLGAIHRAEGGT